MWRSPSGQQQVRGEGAPNSGAVRSLPRCHATIVANIAVRVKHGPRTDTVSSVRKGSRSKLVRRGLTLATTVWLARLVIRKISTGTDTFSGSADMWPPIVKANKRTSD
jgi:hypothetical protein